MDRFANAPYVDGTLSKFRHYAGSPITTRDGYNIGTVFVFKNQPSETGLPPAQAGRERIP